ncbi:MAG: hypothetical protein QW090_04785 [Candidatus Bathyarchaeia archaeon]
MTPSLNLIISKFSELNRDNFEQIKMLLDNICSEIALRFNLCQSDGKPKKSTIIEILASSPCVACALKMFSDRMTDRVETLYKECHKLAVNVLTEELYYILNQLGCNVIISTESELEYGKADVIIRVTNYGLNLKNEVKELLIEVKTGNSLSLTQIFRYFMDSRSETIIIWRITKHQVLVFDAYKIRPLLSEFIRMLCLRGIRLLSSQHTQPCQHKHEQRRNFQQEKIEEMFEKFSKALVETLPLILQVIIEKLEISKPQLPEGLQ